MAYELTRGFEPPFGTILLQCSSANQHSFQFSAHLVPTCVHPQFALVDS